MTAISTARARVLESMALALGYERKRRWRWAPAWLHIWPLWESEQAFRLRVLRGYVRIRYGRGTVADICAAVATVVDCRAESVTLEERGPWQFIVTVPRRLTSRERDAVMAAIDSARPAVTRLVGLREP